MQYEWKWNKNYIIKKHGDKTIYNWVWFPVLQYLNYFPKMVVFVGLGFERKMNLLWTNTHVVSARFSLDASCKLDSKRGRTILWWKIIIALVPLKYSPEGALPESALYWSEYPLHLHNFVWFSVAIGTLARNFVSQFRCRIAYQLRIQTYRIVHKISRNLSRQTGFFSPFLPPFAPIN